MLKPGSLCSNISLTLFHPVNYLLLFKGLQLRQHPINVAWLKHELLGAAYFIHRHT